MKKLALESAKEEKLILERDNAEVRKSPELILEKWKPIILRSMARSALLQAKLMDEIYEKSGRPSLEKEHLSFPFRLPYVKPDYLK